MQDIFNCLHEADTSFSESDQMVDLDLQQGCNHPMVLGNRSPEQCI